MADREITPATLSRHEFVHALTEFVQGPLHARHGVNAAKIDASTPLFESGLIDSLAILDLLAFVERATGRPIPIKKVDIRFFGTIDRIADAFGSDAVLP